MKTNIFDSWLIKTPIAHRGLHDKTSPENSLSAFKNAIDNGFAIEMDIQVTKDKIPLVFHDDTLDRMTNETGLVCEKTYDQIKNLTLKNSKEKIPTFSQFLSFVNGKVPLLIEIKDHKNVGENEQIIADILQEYNGQIAIQSFNPFIVKWFKQNTSFCAGILSSFFNDVPLAWYKKVMLKNLWLTKNAKADFVSYNAQDGMIFGKLKKLKGKMPILFWTVKNQQDADIFKQICDNIIFEGFIPQ